MERNVSETPEKWVILKLPNNYYKVLGSWSGGYLTSDRWKVNSGIKNIEEDNDFYYFIGFSGSYYKCHKKSYGIANSYCGDILNEMLEKSNNQITLMDDKENWLDIISDSEKLYVKVKN